MMEIMNNEKKIVLHPVTNEEQNAFVGIRINNDQIHFHFPESYDLADVSDKKQFRYDFINIIKTISLAKNKSSLNNQSDNGFSSNDNFSIMSYLWIIRDYLSNGYYRNSEKIYQTNGKGKINWKKTLEKEPIVSNGNIIYNNIVAEVRNDCDDIITDAHKLCVYISIHRIGWLFGLNEKSVFVTRTPNSVLKKYVRAIKTELIRTFDDTKKMRLNHMLKILIGVDDSDRTKEIVYGVDKYHYVYERMVDYMFSNVSDITKYNPNANWYLKKNGYEPTEASSLRPDTIRLEQLNSGSCNAKVAYVLDAKFYRFGTTGNVSDLPTTTSIQKQITYGDNIIYNLNKNDNIVRVYNAFIMPYNKNHNKFGYSENLEYIGFSEANWREDNLSHERICAFLIDTKHLVTTWSLGNNSDDIEKLISEIEKAIKYKQTKLYKM